MSGSDLASRDFAYLLASSNTPLVAGDLWCVAPLMPARLFRACNSSPSGTAASSGCLEGVSPAACNGDGGLLIFARRPTLGRRAEPPRARFRRFDDFVMCRLAWALASPAMPEWVRPPLRLRAEGDQRCAPARWELRLK